MVCSLRNMLSGSSNAAAIYRNNDIKCLGDPTITPLFIFQMDVLGTFGLL